jgi:predicted small metal-binding protein
MYTISCRDVGRDCDCVIQGETEEEIMKNAAEHAVKGHGYKEEEIMTPEMKEKIKSHIRKSLILSSAIQQWQSRCYHY